MPIVLKKPGEAKEAAMTGEVLGKAQRAMRERDEQQALVAEMRARQFEIEKAETLSRMDFEQELRDRQFEYEKFNRTKSWEIEKMELALRMDFAQQKQERLKRKAIFNSGIETIDKNEGLTDTQRNMAKFQLASKYADIEEAAPYLGVKPQEQKTGLFNLGGEEMPFTPGVSTAENPLGLNIAQTKTTPVHVSQLPQKVLSLEQRNEFEVISPDGKKETIGASQWPEYKSKGYVLAQIKKLRVTNVPMTQYTY